MAFMPGDTTSLRSGGPSMTVVSTRNPPEGEMVVVVWFDQTGQINQRQFRAELLDAPYRAD